MVSKDAAQKIINNFIVAPDMISLIFELVSKKGLLTNSAQSDWGQDRWEYNGVVVGLGDAGYTKMVKWGDRLHVWWTCGANPVFDRGDINELTILYKGIKKCGT